jgi:hypothetical protein
VAGLLIQMKLSALRHSMTGTRAIWMATGALLGLVLAWGLVILATADPSSTVGDLLAVAFILLALGWVVGPVWSGEPIIRPDHFRLLPIAPRRLAVGLMGAALVGIGAAVTVLAFASLIVYAARLGAGPVAVGVAAVVLEVLFVVALSRVAAGVFGRLTTSRLGGVVAGMATAGLLIVTQWGWVVIERAGHLLDTGVPAALSAVVRALPSGWGLVAIDAADRSEWVLAGGALLGLGALIALLVTVWSRMIGSPRTPRATIRGSRHAGLERAIERGRTRSVVVRELRAWWRDPSRLDLLVVAPSFVLLTSLLPLIYDSPAALAWAGPVTALLGAATAANLIGLDGTALWLTLLTPGAVHHEVRGRQWAWLALFGPITIAFTVPLAALSGGDTVWPWALALSAAFLGAGAGLVVYVAVTQPAPGPDPRRRSSALDHGDTTGQGIFTVFAGLVLATPAAAVVLIGEVVDRDAVRWAGVPVAVLFGWLLAWWLGRAAVRRLEARGPELLQLMRTGRIHQPGAVAQRSAIESMSGRTKALFFTCIWLGSLALFPQGIVPMVIKLTGGGEPVWFVALYLPPAWQWPAIVLMIALGVFGYWIAFRLYRAHRPR